MGLLLKLMRFLSGLFLDWPYIYRVDVTGTKQGTPFHHIFDYVNFIASINNTDHLFEIDPNLKCGSLDDKPKPVITESFKATIEITDFIREETFTLREYYRHEDNAVRLDFYYRGNTDILILHPEEVLQLYKSNSELLPISKKL